MKVVWNQYAADKESVKLQLRAKAAQVSELEKIAQIIEEHFKHNDYLKHL